MDHRRIASDRQLAVVAGLFFAVATTAAPITDRMTLVEAIEAVRDAGIDVAWSSRHVAPWMRVRKTPGTDDPVAALRAALAAYRLDLVEGPDGRWLVVEGSAAPIEPGGRPEPPPTPPRPHAPDVAAPLEEVVIVASRYSMFDRRGFADQFLTADEIRSMPHLADDSFRALHRLPGAAASDFQAPFHLRGGALDEIKVVLDGLELFEPFHMRSLFSPLSIVDPGIIRDAQVLSGGFGVDHGNHMSGVLDITTLTPDDAPAHEIGVSFVSSFVRSLGTVDDGRGGYQLSLRRGYLDLIADKLVDEGEELDPRYLDLFAKLRYSATDSLDVTLQGLHATDDVRFSDPGDGERFSEDSSLGYLWAIADWVPTDSLRVRTVLFGGQIDTFEEGEQVNPPAELIDRQLARVTDVTGIKSDLEIKLSDRRLWRFGGRLRHLEGEYAYFVDAVRQSDFVNDGFPYSVARDSQTRREGDEFGIYAAYRFRPHDRLVIEAGLRRDKQTYTDLDDDSQTSARLNAVLSLGERTSLRTAWGRYHQPQAIDELQIIDGVMNYSPAERADHAIVGLRHRFPAGLELKADAYHKRYADLRPRFENALDVYEYAGETNFDRVRVAPDAATAYGVELTLSSRSDDAFDWWVNYTWSRVEDEIAGVDVPRSWDQRHAVTANLVWRRGSWTLSALGRYHSGWPRTPLLVLPVLDDAGVLIGIDSDLSRRNDTHFDAYSRIDLRLSRHVELENGSFDWYVEIFNVFDADNQCCVTNHELSIGSAVTATPEIDTYTPLFPSFGFAWRFGPGAN